MDTREFKEKVKAAATYLATNGVDVPHTRLLEAISRAFGERNWSTMRALLERAEPAVAGKSAAPAPLVLEEPPFQTTLDNAINSCSVLILDGYEIYDIQMGERIVITLPDGDDTVRGTGWRGQ